MFWERRMRVPKSMMKPFDPKAGRRRLEILGVFALCFVATLFIRYRTELFGPSDPGWFDPIDHFKYEYLTRLRLRPTRCIPEDQRHSA